MKQMTKLILAGTAFVLSTLSAGAVNQEELRGYSIVVGPGGEEAPERVFYVSSTGKTFVYVPMTEGDDNVGYECPSLNSKCKGAEGPGRISFDGTTIRFILPKYDLDWRAKIFKKKAKLVCSADPYCSVKKGNHL